MIDIGTGDGRAVLRLAGAEPSTLAIGIDAVADAMADASRRAARPVRKGGLPNALFVVAAAEALPAELWGSADEVTIQFPWGSLLRGLVGQDALLCEAVARLLRPGGRLTLVLSIIERDRSVTLGALDEPALEGIARAFERVGLLAGEIRQVESAEARGIGSSWARRLRAGGADRPAWCLRFERPRARPQG